MQLVEIKGVGEKTEKLFQKIGIDNVSQLLLNYPRDYKTYPKPILITEAVQDSTCAVLGTIKRNGIAVKHIKKMSILSAMVESGQSTFQIVFFNSPYLKNALKPGMQYVFYGKTVVRGNKFSMDQPKLFSYDEYSKLLDRLHPVYGLTKGLTNKAISNAVRNAFMLEHDCLKEFMPKSILDKYSFLAFEEAVRQMHMPDDEQSLIKARERLAYQDFFLFLLQMHQMQDRTVRQSNDLPMKYDESIDAFMNALPYQLTDDQKTVFEEIRKDLSSENMMSRLVQGDVGSGKTIIAVLALLCVVKNGYQGALMAPTEVLASQHYESILSLTKAYELPFAPVLLTGSLTAKQKKDAYLKIASGEANVIIGTHALIQDKVSFHNLALAITDEQHRFGVKQRQFLSKKGTLPHILVMSATPIPRTLAMILYGDFDLSIIRQMPNGRLPIKNCVVSPSYRATSYKFMQSEISKGRQIYIICPMVSENPEMDLENVEDYTEKLKMYFPDEVSIRFLHGKMKPALKNEIMEAFKNKEIDILVSTTVIEVGINVPNATVMMIENAERFGLAQLHQLRGRVGRGSDQAYCIFINSSDNEQAKERLKVLEQSNDGFFIAEEDMKRRGPGDLFGVRQSGTLEFSVADIYQDSELLKKASDDIRELLEKPTFFREEEGKRLLSFLEKHSKMEVDYTSL